VTNNNRTGLESTEILEALAHSSLVELRNYGDRWGIIYRTGHGGECAELTSSDFDNLLSVWAKTCDRWTNAGGDEGVYEQTAGIAPNAGGDAYEPL
jgi:hypothetical protein